MIDLSALPPFLPLVAMAGIGGACLGILGTMIWALRIQSRLRSRIASLETAAEHQHAAHEEKISALMDVRGGIEKDMKILADSLLKENSDRFLERAREAFEAQAKVSRQGLETLVTPLDAQLKAYQDLIGRMEQARKRDEGAIVEHLRHMAEGHEKLRTTTNTLVSALRSAPKTRGRWGEQQLRTVLEMSGMIEHVDFLTEYHVRTEEGRLVPDAVLRLPGGRRIVVDAKTPMNAYLEAVEAADESVRDRLLLDHARQLRAHARQLGSKAYWEALGDTPDFVVMFVPGDNLYAAAVERDPALFDAAYDAQVIIATPTTFLALAKAMAFGWRQDRVSQNSRQVLEEGTELYRRLKALGEKVAALSMALDKAVGRHNDLVGTLEARVMPGARRMHDLGLATTAGEIGSLAPVDKAVRGPQPGRDLDGITPELPL